LEHVSILSGLASPQAIDQAYSVAETSAVAMRRYLEDPRNQPIIKCALRISAVETALFDLFGQGKLHGTIHTCIGQEFSGAMLGSALRPDDFVTSNHRCHGHFIGATGNWRGLIDEIVGNKDGVCAGIGSSQHLWAPNFLSNGQQGGLLPVGAGLALDRKLGGKNAAVVSFIGEGTLGEGIVYETLNLDALWDLPHVIVCENNLYSQSTPQRLSVAGSIADRAASFGIATDHASTWDLEEFESVLVAALERARRESRPSFIVLATYRLNPHSRGDDLRDKGEIEWFRARDPARLAIRDYAHFAAAYSDYAAEADDAIKLALQKPALAPQHYFADQLPRADISAAASWTQCPAPAADDGRVAQQLNAYYTDFLRRHGDALFIGEDIEDPYGGAFKIARGLTTTFGQRARTTPISEAAITGIGIGLSMAGRRTFVEMMFGDFTTYAFDQLVNNASKIFHMTNRNATCPVILRTPMGGRRGYGPTHSQSLERFLIGMDNCCVISLNALAPAATLLNGLDTLCCPVILLENKSDYAAKPFVAPDGFVLEMNGAALPTLRLRPAAGQADVTIFAYGGMARFVAQSIVDIFRRTDLVPEMIVPLGLSPVDPGPVADSVRQTGRLVIVEEGPSFGSAGAEVAAQLMEGMQAPFAFARIGGKPVPIPSAPSLEEAVLPGIADICTAIRAMRGATA
jgi:2-oxoisovalerate dehydrogenase E1 component